MSARREELYAVLVSLATDTLLLPNAAVQEVVSADRITPPPKGTPPWFVGSITHQNVTVPVVRFETLSGQASADDGKRTRLAVVHAITDKLRTGLYAVVCQGYPHLVTLNRAAMKVEPHQSRDSQAYVLSRVAIANTSALIPNLEAIEQQLSQVEATS